MGLCGICGGDLGHGPLHVVERFHDGGYANDRVSVGRGRADCSVVGRDLFNYLVRAEDWAET